MTELGYAQQRGMCSHHLYHGNAVTCLEIPLLIPSLFVYNCALILAGGYKSESNEAIQVIKVD